jgi:hypothetical protein
MGLETAKSLLVVKDGKTFLDLIAEQVKVMRAAHGSAVKFILMDSFSTSDDTRAFLAKAHADLLGEPHIELLQNMSPKVDAATFAPATYPQDPDMEWWVDRGMVGGRSKESGSRRGCSDGRWFHPHHPTPSNSLLQVPPRPRRHLPLPAGQRHAGRVGGGGHQVPLCQQQR